MTFWNAVRRRLEAGVPVFAMLVVANTRGSPGTLGARLLLDRDGAVEGTIGGGIMEARLVEQAQRRLGEGSDTPPSRQRLVHRKTGTDHPSGLICAGEQTNLSLIFDPQRDREAVRCFCQALAEPGGQAMWLTIDARGVRVSPEAPRAAAPGIHWFDDGDHWRYAESSINPRRLAIVGGGHCGLALARLGIDIGYAVDVFDTRRAVLTRNRWPETARLHLLQGYHDLATQLAQPALTTVVVMTAAVDHDIEALAGLAALDLRWLGVMGSAAKIRVIRTALRDRGVTRERIAAIHGPIGLRMKSDTPAEIAVSIMSQLLAQPCQESRSERQPGKASCPGPLMTTGKRTTRS